MKTHPIGLVIVAGWFAFPAALAAAPAVFTVDSSQSEISLTGKIAGTTIQEQGAGSLKTRYAGTIRAEVSGSAITFTGGSRIDAEVNGEWQPKAEGVAGTAPADYGGRAVSLFSTVNGAFRNLLLDVTSAAIPISDGKFDASALTFSFPEGASSSLDYDLIVFKGSIALSGLATNRVTSAATLVTTGELQTMVIEVDTEYGFKALTSNDSQLRLTGWLVATRPSPISIGPVVFADKKLSFTVDGAGGEVELQSSTDLKTWARREAERTVAGGRVTFTAEQSGGIEFFRAVK